MFTVKSRGDFLCEEILSRTHILLLFSASMVSARFTPVTQISKNLISSKFSTHFTRPVFYGKSLPGSASIYFGSGKAARV